MLPDWGSKKPLLTEVQSKSAEAFGAAVPDSHISNSHDSHSLGFPFVSELENRSYHLSPIDLINPFEFPSRFQSDVANRCSYFSHMGAAGVPLL